MTFAVPDFPFALPAPNRVASAVDQILARWPGIAPEPRGDREKLVQDMRDRLLIGNWRGVTMMRAAEAAQALFDPERRNRADLSDLRQFYLDEIRAQRGQAFFDSMVGVYLTSFEPGSEHSVALADALSSRRDGRNGRWQKLFMAVPDLLVPSRVVAAFSTAMNELTEPYQGLQKLGLPSPHAPGIIDHVHLKFVESLKPRLGTREGIAHLFAWLAPTADMVRQTGAREAVEALLDAWDASPPEDIRREICRLIVGTYSDPRLHPGGLWSAMRQDLKDKMLRWLTGEDMKFFCDVVTATQDSHMWKPRRDYWLKRFRDKRIDEAWVAFCPEATHYAQRNLRAGNVRRFGRQVAGGGRGDTSLLIMKIGRKIVVDGCHNYMTHIFDADDPKAPRLYQPAYDCERIRHASYRSKSHSSIPSWIDWIERST